MTSLPARVRNSPAFWATLRHLKQIAIVAVPYFVYMFVRKIIIPDIEPGALENAIKVLSFESAAGFLWEPHWQAWAIEHSRPLIVFLNWVYIITFWPILLSTAVFVYVVDREKYFYFRNVVLLSFIFALIVFASFPLAPPRFLPEYGFIDSIQRFGPTWYGSREMASFYNAYAAMPSLHFGWSVLFGILFLRMKHKWLKPFGLIYPAMTFFAITVTANHYIIDAVGGAAIIAASFLLYEASLRLNLPSPLSLATAQIQQRRPAYHVRAALLRVYEAPKRLNVSRPRSLVVNKIHRPRPAYHLPETLLRWRTQVSQSLTTLQSRLKIDQARLKIDQVSSRKRRRWFAIRMPHLKGRRTWTAAPAWSRLNRRLG